MFAVRKIAAKLAKASSVAACLAASQPALAQQYGPITAYYPDTGAPAPDKAVLTIPVTASVGGTCGVQTPFDVTVYNPNIDTTGWTNQVAFMPECTARWRIAVSSLKGAMRSDAPIEAGYTNVAPYDVALHINSDDGAIDSSCPVAQIDQALATSPCAFHGTATNTDGLSVARSFQLSGTYIQVSAPAYPGPNRLVEGFYTDTLTVTVSPAS